MSILKALSVIAMMNVIVPVALAQDLPPPVELQGSVATALPGYWKVTAFRIIATSDLGDAAQPRRVVRFEADAVPSVPLFAEASVEGPYMMVVPTVAAEGVRTLYGTLDLTYRAGKWSGPAVIENPVTGLGQPLSLFTAPTLELGSDEAAARLAALRDQSVGAAAAALEREMSQKRAAHAAALAALEAENARALEELRVRHAGLLATATEKTNKGLEVIQTKSQTDLAKIVESTAPLIAEAKTERERLLAAEREAAAAALREAREAASRELDTLAADHARTRGALIATQTQELAEIETGLALERRSLERQLENAQEVIALQKDLAAALTARDLGAGPLFEIFEAARRQKVEFLARIPKEWRGTMDCADTGGKGLLQSSRIVTLAVEGVSPEGMQVIFGGPGFRDDRAMFMISDKGFAFPIALRATMHRDGMIEANEFDVLIHQDGQMLSEIVGDRDVNGVQVNVTCRMRLSS
ncbi:MAG: hypothetical protein ACT4OK_13660 [Gemmobacter sp.]